MNIKAGILSLGLAVFFILLKLYAWVETDSLSIFTSLIDSSFDAVISLMNFMAVRYALKPADDEHPYGHESIEDIVGLLQAAFIFGSACFILYEALQRFFHPVEINNGRLGIAVMVVSIILSTMLVFYQRMVAAKTGSLVIKSDSLHYLSDIFSGIMVIASLCFSGIKGMGFIDPLLATAISVYISYNAYGIGKRAYDNLMNKEISPEQKEHIVKLITLNPDIKGFHDIKTRYSGSKIFIQFDIELSPEITLKKGHDISDEIMFSIIKAYPNSEVVIHLDYEHDS